MQRKAYVPGVAVLLAAVLAACTGSDDSSATDDARPGGATATSVAQPGRYDTLPEPCGSVDHGTLDSLLPGIKQLTDEATREQAYEGEATLTYDTDRKVGCRWKAESTSATDYLLIDFERVVSYDDTVSGDSKAQEVYGGKVAAADLPEPSPTESAAEEEEEQEQDGTEGAEEASASPSESASPSGSESGSGDGADASGTASGSASASATPASLLPRTLDDLGDEAFLDDTLGTSGQRTVTVVFRTSNVIVTVEYEEQPATTTDVPDSEEMQDRARNLAEQLAGAFDD
ncbi:DUF3558 domain-containing protein [Streptomyces ipomoeae]|uniref:DUF3558 domain-containing protein n=1 Tax=Streptomyces ipomoeae TaxID=103232 RepID=UPI0029B3DA49|nr:DUF3558 domain-containing protein [Streptomyces ipomoeae]MDX2700188.1 DUF3558 domain-containing protein [Streptomyces ipomoeae]MDX2828119.1 DUF3558 domain-containing protein [Streptomyces ipomoeae]MDX2845830.1 DUF3558 domain-containing protein [Streptomyces ipomoeae]MDX2880632.1 DUF3558 domain-containing protein [Streptomyces ipomoeae]